MIPQAVKHQYKLYHDLIIQYWNQMTPMQYVTVLVSIGVVGWLLMKNSAKR
jgi:hypothetical protein